MGGGGAGCLFGRDRRFSLVGWPPLGASDPSGRCSNCLEGHEDALTLETNGHAVHHEHVLGGCWVCGEGLRHRNGQPPVRAELSVILYVLVWLCARRDWTNECEKEHVTPPYLNNTISSTAPTIVITLPSTQEDHAESSLTSARTPTPVYVVSYRIPWWTGVIMAVGVVVSILGAFLSAKWALARAHTCHSSHPQFPQDNIKVRTINIPHLQLTPDVIPENTSCSSTSYLNPSQQRTIPIATPSQAECVIELKSYMNRFQAPCLRNYDGDFSGHDELNEHVKTCDDELEIDGIGEEDHSAHGNTQHMNQTAACSSACADYNMLDKKWQENSRRVPVFQGIPQGRCPEDIPCKNSDDALSVKYRPRAPSPPRVLTSDVRENSLYDSVNEDKHVYATPSARPAGAAGLSSALREYVHTYEEPPNYPEGGMVSATSTDFLFKPPS